jgi:hypothetical protein
LIPSSQSLHDLIDVDLVEGQTEAVDTY